MDVRTARGDLWRRARTLDGVQDQARSARARLLARRMRPAAAPVDWRGVIEAPAWSGWSEGQRKRLAVVAGAILMAERLATTIDGRVLAAVGRIVGEAALDQVLALPPGDRPEAPPLASLEPEVLEGLGAAALLAGLDAATTERLGRDLAAPLLRLDAEQAAAARYQALRITEATA
jgi:hypothetical protein